MAHRPLDRTYRALFRVPDLGRIILAMQIARIAQSMVSVAIILFTLTEYDSPALAGIVTFASILPGLLCSPIAGALLDRHGRVRLVMLDYLVAMGALLLIGILALEDALSPVMLVAITTISSLTAILSNTGLRSLFPIIVPRHLWERVNAVDANGYVVATIIGPPVAATLVAVVGGPTALIVIAIGFGLAVLAIFGVKDPPVPIASTGRLLVDALEGLRYTWRNRTLRGLGLSLTTLNIASGMTTIVIPLLVIDRLGSSAAVVGLLFAASGIAGMASALWFGRMDTHGREWKMFVLPAAGMAPSLCLLLIVAIGTGGTQLGAGVVGTISVAAGLGLIALYQGITGFLNGPMDIALFTVRQRRTDPAWMGRAFAVSMAFNFMGFPIGAALAGVLASVSLEAAILVGIAAAVLGAILAVVLVPVNEEPART